MLLVALVLYPYTGLKKLNKILTSVLYISRSGNYLVATVVLHSVRGLMQSARTQEVEHILHTVLHNRLGRIRHCIFNARALASVHICMYMCVITIKLSTEY